MIADAVREFEVLIRQLPQVGPHPAFRQFAVSGGWFLPTYGGEIRSGGHEEAGDLALEEGEA
jgi:hypothetical protein